MPGGVGIALTLFVLAYAESLLRSLRRGRKRVTATIGMAVIGALLGVTMVVGVWLVARQEPVVATVAVCAALGMVGGAGGGHRRPTGSASAAASACGPVLGDDGLTPAPGP